MMVAGFGYGLWRKHSNPVEFTWSELPIQLLVGTIATVGCFGAFLFWSSGLYDTEVWNGKATKAIYEEEWTELVHYTEEVCTGSGKNQTCTTVARTREDYHPPEWTIKSTSGTVSIKNSQYRNTVNFWGNERQTDDGHIGQISYGDGRTFQTKWNGKADTVIPTAIEHPYVNYLKASKSIQKRSGTSSPYAKLLLSYPGVHSGKYGSIELNRVLSAGLKIPANWKSTVDRNLDLALASLGAQKQVNILVYVVNSSDRSFLHALEEHWILGKKNDVVVLIGATEFPKVNWAGVMIFNGNQSLVVKLRDAIEEQKDLSDPTKFSQMVVKHVQSEFKRVPMKELEYLLHDIEIPWWSILLIFIMSGTVIILTSHMLENNNIRNWRLRRS